MRELKAGYIFFVLLQIVSFIFSISAYARDGKAYLIGPNDVINFTIFAGGEKQHDADLTVSYNGTINAPFIGTVKVDGLTPSQLEVKITKPLSEDYFVNPKVNISIKEYHSLHYYISGAVNKPGMYVTATEATFLELIAKAEGLLPERGNLAYIMRISNNEGVTGEELSHSEPIKVDLQRLLDKGDMSANPILMPGDVIYIPLNKALDLAESKIYVEGEVKKPGIYDYQPGMTAMNACIMAGGFDRFAAPNRTRVIRKKDDDLEITKINLDHVKNGEIPDIELKPGDRVHVPETWL
jgi:polysaccharide export outer membrane protein